MMTSIEGQNWSYDGEKYESSQKSIPLDVSRSNELSGLLNFIFVLYLFMYFTMARGIQQSRK